MFVLFDYMECKFWWNLLIELKLLQVLQESSQIVSLIHSFLNDNTNSETFRALAEHFENITSNSDDKAAKYTIKNYGLDDQDGFK